MVLVFQSFCSRCWLFDSVANIYIGNNLKIFVYFFIISTDVRDFMENSILLVRKNVCLSFISNNRLKKVTLILSNIFYTLNVLSNLIYLGQIDNNLIFYDKKNKYFYNIKYKKLLTMSKNNKKTMSSSYQPYLI